MHVMKTNVTTVQRNNFCVKLGGVEGTRPSIINNGRVVLRLRCLLPRYSTGFSRCVIVILPLDIF